MLLGEHAVLHGHPCLVAAIEKRIRVSLLPRTDGLVTITSSLGQYEGDRDDLPDHPSFRFIIGALRELPDSVPGGIDLSVQADMPPTIGFGTSAAVTAATIGALQMVTRGAWSMPGILEHAHRVIETVQGRGSGADAAASVYGGIVYYRTSKSGVEIVNGEAHPLTALYCGYKTPTAEAISRVEKKWKGREKELRDLYSRISNSVERGRSALSVRNPEQFGNFLNEGNELMAELGVSTPELEQCCGLLRSQSSITGAKISGSGLGDCVVGWGKSDTLDSKFEQYDMTVAPGGIRVE